jgi:subtilisin family serine protease
MKKQTQILLCVMILLQELAGAKSSSFQRTWIFFQDKGTTTLRPVSQVELGISERALKRRAKVLPPNHLIDQLDLPISETVITQIKQTGVKIRTISRWLNAVSVEATEQQLKVLTALPIVAVSTPVAVFRRPLIPMTTNSQLYKSSDNNPVSNPPLPASVSGIDYGSSATQLTNMKAVDLHAVGVNGTGVLIGMLDDGFNNHRTHNALKNIHVLAEYDFIQRDSNTSIAQGEYSTQGNHGAATLSVVGGYDNSNLIGAAFGASFILAKTEIDSVEIQVEEDNYVEAMEWMERLGVDITSSSLGYYDLDPMGFYNPGDVVYKMKDGRTAITTRIAAIAARKGVLVVTAVGNEHWGKKDTVSILDTLTGSVNIVWEQKNIKGINDTLETGSLVTPADADSIIAVGATSSNGELATFSSTGPTADGRIKPDVVAQGMGVYCVEGITTSGYEYAQGTSFSTPLVAGAAALIFSAHPELTPMQVREALIQTAVHVNNGTSQTATYPNNYYGHGFISVYAAALFHGPIFSNTPRVKQIDSLFSITINIASTSGLVPDSLFLYYRYGQSGTFLRKKLNFTGITNEYSISITRATESLVYGYFYAREQSGYVSRFPFNAPESLFLISVNQVPTSYVLYNNFPNPFNSGTTLSFDAPKTEHAELSVLNILGQHIATIFSGEAQSGRNSFLWDGKNAKGVYVASGIYFYRLKTSGTVIAKKMVFLK